jgi:hypothetical protein
MGISWALTPKEFRRAKKRKPVERAMDFPAMAVLLFLSTYEDR